MVVRDRLPDSEAGRSDHHPRVVQPPPGAALRRGRACRLLLRTAVVDAIVVVPSSTHANLYALLQCGEEFEYGRKAYCGYNEVFWAEDGEFSSQTSGNFKSDNA
jgi:hypothetical protein